MKYTKRIQKHVFSWGGTLLTSYTPLLGYVSIVGSVAGGTQFARAQSNDTTGDTLAQMHAAMLMEGTSKHTKQQLQILLDTIGATLTFTSTADRLVFNARVHTDHLKTLLSLLVEILTCATFPEHELAILRTHMSSDLALETQDTRTQATIALTRALYAPGHWLRDDTTQEALLAMKTISRTTLIEYHRTAISRDSFVMSIVGDIKNVPIQTYIDTYFKKLSSQEIIMPMSTTTHVYAPQLIKTQIQDKSSIDYMIAITTGITDKHIDYPALLLGINILARWGGFTGRLMKTTRETEGLTYVAYGRLAGFSIADGYISIWSSFAPELFEKGRASINTQITKIITEGIKTEEFKKHRAMFEANSRVLCADSMSLARTAHETVMRRRPLSYLDTFPQQILTLTKKQVESALRTYLIPGCMTESAAGPVSN